MKLKHVARLIAGGTPRVDDLTLWAREDEPGVAWTSIGDMSAGGRVISTTRRVNGAGVASKRLQIGSPGTVLFAMYASVGAVATLGIDAVWNQALLGVVPRSDLADSRFVAYWLQHLSTDLGALVRTSTQDNLNAEQVANFPFPDLTIQEQRRIADFLDAQVPRIDQGIALRKRQGELVAEQLAVWLDQQVQELGSNFGWAEVRRFTRGIEQGGSPLADNAAANAGEAGVLKTSAIKNGRFVESENKALLHLEDLESRYIIHRGDVVVVRGSGSGDLVADAAWVKDEPSSRLMLSDLTYRLRSPRVLPAFLTFVLISRSVRGEIRSLVRQGSGPAKVRGEDVLGVSIPDVPSDEQHRLADQYTGSSSNTDELVQRLTMSLELLQERKRALITAAVTGEFDVSTASGRNTA